MGVRRSREGAKKETTYLAGLQMGDSHASTCIKKRMLRMPMANADRDHIGLKMAGMSVLVLDRVSQSHKEPSSR